MVALKAVVCSPEQRERFDQYVQALARTGRLPASESFAPYRKVRPAEVAAVVVGMPLDSVATRLGGPFQVWPSYPRGFIWLYSTDEAVGAYVAVTFDGTQFFLYMYRPQRNCDFVKYELTPATYAANTAGPGADLFIGGAGNRRALFAPFPGPDAPLYPFSGKIEEVAVYSIALKEERIASHIMACLNNL